MFANSETWLSSGLVWICKCKVDGFYSGDLFSGWKCNGCSARGESLWGKNKLEGLQKIFHCRSKLLCDFHTCSIQYFGTGKLLGAANNTECILGLPFLFFLSFFFRFNIMYACYCDVSSKMFGSMVFFNNFVVYSIKFYISAWSFCTAFRGLALILILTVLILQ